MTPEELHAIRLIVYGACSCGSGGHPRRCTSHPDLYAAHVASLGVDSRCDDRFCEEQLDLASKTLETAHRESLRIRDEAIKALLKELAK